MIPQASTSTVEGTLGGDSTAGSVDQEDMAHIMQILTDLYSDNTGAILREYSTNARDVHIKYNVDRPIEVSLPSRLSNTLTIKDFGPGQDAEELKTTYTKYGRSNKRASKEENGFLGLGSKSALTYTSTFTVVSVKNGIKTQAVIFRDEEDLLRLNIISAVPTDEHSGTTVTIPTKLGDNFQSKAENFYKVWDKGTVVVNGVQPNHIGDDKDFVKVGNHYIRQTGGYRVNDRLHVVMGNVAYTVDVPSPVGFRVALESYSFVPNGSVKFTPSREALDLKPATKAVVDATWKEATDLYMKHIMTSFEQSKTIREAVQAYLPLRNMLTGYANVSWRGIPMQESYNFGGRDYTKGRSQHDPGSTSKQDSMPLATAYRKDTVFLKNRSSKSSLNGGEKARLKAYLDMKLPDVRTVYFNGELHDALGGVEMLDWEDVLNATKTVTAPRPKSIAGTWEYWITDGTRMERKFGTLPDAKVILFGSNTELGLDTYNPIKREFINHVGPDTMFINVAINRQEKFKRDNPQAIHFYKFLTEFTEKVKNSLTEEEKRAYRAYQAGMTTTYVLLAGKTEDKIIDQINDTMDTARLKVQTADAIMRMTRRGSITIDGEDYIEENYPLVDTDKHLDHSINYINYIKNGK